MPKQHRKHHIPEEVLTHLMTLLPKDRWAEIKVIASNLNCSPDVIYNRLRNRFPGMISKSLGKRNLNAMDLQVK